ncbi:adenylate kinase [Kitasatospora paracochleata]|uniref:Adenylate kinase n=1 Tax=Kitasatospora paracochleata TaxID=58354 RepID=A0ABT1IWM9_9ACTN|nr:nucleoside monophosphate kinase [Kitasatospora paracochleata]MCP2309313.1 adenylate kinase [Kitasatospora paracochleata]
MRLALLQPPAWLREGPADSLARALTVARINFGDLLRAHIRQGTQLGLRSSEILHRGPLPDELITEIVRDHLRRTAPAAFLLDHHPLNAAQALALDELLHELGTPLDKVVHLRLPTEEVERRVRHQSARRLCRSDPTHHHKPSAGTHALDACNICGGELYQREDDTEKNIRGRFSRHEATVAPISHYYARQGRLVVVDAVGTPDETAGRVLSALRWHGH